MSKSSENELAKIITEWLLAESWLVYEEISPSGGNGRRCDLVAKKGAIIWAIETKRSFNLDVLEQATGWLSKAHFSSIAIWQSNRLTEMTEKVCRKFSVGLITVRNWGVGESRFTVTERVEGFFNRRADTSAILRMLDEETKATGNAGKAAQIFDTPFKRTCRSLTRVVRENPGIEFEAAIRRSNHHYKSDSKANMNLLIRVRMNEIADIIYVQDGKRFLLFPADFEASGGTLPIIEKATAATMETIVQGELF